MAFASNSEAHTPTCYLRCSCGHRVDAATRPDAWLLLDAHVESVHGHVVTREFNEPDDDEYDHLVAEFTARPVDA